MELNEDLDLVAGWRQNRQDGLFLRKIPSKIANRLIARMTGVHLRDYGCSLKAFRGSVIKSVRLYGEMHRFIPAWLAGQGLYGLVRSGTKLPVFMTSDRALVVFVMILTMCMASAALAMRKLADADPAEIF